MNYIYPFLSFNPLFFNSNKFLCDCKLRYFSYWLGTHHQPATTTAQCVYPKDLKGKSVLALNDSKYKCSESSVFQSLGGFSDSFRQRWQRRHVQTLPVEKKVDLLLLILLLSNLFLTEVIVHALENRLLTWALQAWSAPAGTVTLKSVKLKNLLSVSLKATF